MTLAGAARAQTVDTEAGEYRLASSASEQLGDLSLEELSQLEVTTVSRRPEALRDAAASVYVIHRTDILRTGVQILPEALRLAPNLSVSRVDALDYAISARGMNGFESSNKLLVMIDGRSVYSAFFAGVEWSQQVVQLADLDRIEVVSGPGGALWGANAVNGVINIQSRSAADTQGVLLNAAAGTADNSINLRYGGAIGDRAHFRVFAGALEQGDLRTPGGQRADDGYRGSQIGFRFDWHGDRDTVTLQGDSTENAVDLLTGTPGPERGHADNRNLLGRWTRTFSDDSILTVQAYYDRYARRARGIYDSVETGDVSVQYATTLGRHRVVVGGGYRGWEDDFINFVNAFTLDPPRRRLWLGNVFLQDQVDLGQNLTLTLGLKGEHSAYSGDEWMPSLRLSWRASDTAMLWGAVSRAVRSPARLDRDLVFPGLLVQSQFEPETLVAYELGYRGQPTPDLTLSATIYRHDYDDVRSTETTPVTGLPLTIGNGLKGYTQGVEAWSDLDVTPTWRLGIGMSYMDAAFRRKASSTDISDLAAAGADPKLRLSLRSNIQLSDRVSLYAGLRHMGRIEDAPVAGLQATAAYTEADARLAWQISDAVELSVAGFDLLNEQHADAAEARRYEVGRRVQAGLKWTW